MTLRVEATGRMPTPQPIELKAATVHRPFGYRTVSFEAAFARSRSTTGRSSGQATGFAGPAIVSQFDATTFVAQGWTGEVHGSGALLLTFG